MLGLAKKSLRFSTKDTIICNKQQSHKLKKSDCGPKGFRGVIFMFKFPEREKKKKGIALATNSGDLVDPSKQGMPI